MTTVFITGRAALNDAAMLIDRYGDDAGFEEQRTAPSIAATPAM